LLKTCHSLLLLAQSVTIPFNRPCRFCVESSKGFNIKETENGEEEGQKPPRYQRVFSDAGQAAFYHFDRTRPKAVTQDAREIEHAATNALRQDHPAFSAAFGLSGAQTAGLLAIIWFSVICIWQYGELAILALNAFFSLFFAALVIIRLGAYFLVPVEDKRKDGQTPDLRRDEDLPVYSVLVPVFHEAAVLPQLVAALEQIDYPSDKLDIKLIFEEDDAETLEQASSLSLPRHFECLIVPRGSPQTKPRALDYALVFAHGDFVTIFDAEDIPAKDQLRCALHAFENGSENLACVQAPLGFYNSGDNWLTRQFTLEYAALFHILLPTLAAFKLPLLLGGTSNHFKIHILRQIGGWDPFNVTEDADLGIRFSRMGYQCGVIWPQTQEEANGRLQNWLRQRSRWLKGWMQTYTVHMRNPLLLWRELGPKGFLTFQALAGGMIISALAYPVFLVLLGLVLFQNQLFAGLNNWTGYLLLSLNGFNFVIGYTAAAMLGAEGVRRIGKMHIARSAFGVPFYWLLVSLGAYFALWQFFTKPFYWEKTNHGLSPNMPRSSGDD